MQDREDKVDKSAIRKSLHDLNNLFTSNLATLEKLKSFIPDTTETNVWLSSLFSNYHRSLEIVESMSGDKRHIFTRISLNELLTDVISSFKPTLPNSILLETEIIKKLPKIDGNYTELHRVLTNLLANAKEAISTKGTISVSAFIDKQSENVIISVSDNGIGIKRENLAPIFSEGFSTKEKKYVSGYGLSIVKEIVENHRGKIDVKSEQNIGATFTIHLPISKKKIMSAGAKKILLVDDDATILELLTDLLKSYNYEVDSADNGRSAFSLYSKSANYDLIIVDKIMKDLDGLKLIESIRKTDKNIPIILTTGSYETIESDLSKLNISRKIKKPFDFDQILSEINSVLF